MLIENASIDFVYEFLFVYCILRFFDKEKVFFKIDEMSSEFEIIDNFVHFRFTILFV